MEYKSKPSELLSVENMSIKLKKEQYTYEIRKGRTEMILNAKRAKISLKDGIKPETKPSENKDPNQEGSLGTNDHPRKEKMRSAFMKLLDGLHNKNEQIILNSVHDLRLCVSEDANIPYNDLISLGLKEILTELLTQWNKNTGILYESLWLTINMLCAPYSKISTLLTNEFVRANINFLFHPDIDVVESAAQVLTNIAGDIEQTIGVLLEEKIAESITRFTERPKGVTEDTYSHLANLIANLFKLLPLLNIAESLITLGNEEVTMNCMFAFANATLWPEAEVKAILTTVPNLLKLLVKTLDYKSDKIRYPAIQALGNLTSFSIDLLIENLIDLGLLTKLKSLYHSKTVVVKQSVIWVLSNILAENANVIEKVFAEGIVADMITDALIEIPEIVEEVLLCVYNIIGKGTSQQINKMQEHGVMALIANCLKQINHPNVIIRALVCFQQLLKQGQEMKELKDLPVNPYVVALETEGAYKDFEALQNHTNDEIYKLVTTIIDDYFSEFISPS